MSYAILGYAIGVVLIGALVAVTLLQFHRR